MKSILKWPKPKPILPRRQIIRNTMQLVFDEAGISITHESLEFMIDTYGGPSPEGGPSIMECSEAHAIQMAERIAVWAVVRQGGRPVNTKCWPTNYQRPDLPPEIRTP